MVATLVRVEQETDPLTIAVLRGGEYLARGIDATLIGLASNILAGKVGAADTLSEPLVNTTLDSLVGAARKHGEAFAPFRTSAGHTLRLPIIGETQGIKNLLQQYLWQFFLEELHLQEVLDGTSLAMVAGQQGSGKDSTLSVFREIGYEGASMSGTVQDVASAWGYDRTATRDKITVGKKLKELLGQGILVPITVARMAAQGTKNIVMFGPRVIDEAEAILDLGGTLIGMAADPDYELDKGIRRARIVHRATLNPSRAGDVAKFDEREEIEGPKIIQILSHPQCHFFVDSSPLDEFRNHFKKFVTPLLVQKK